MVANKCEKDSRNLCFTKDKNYQYMSKNLPVKLLGVRGK